MAFWRYFVTAIIAAATLSVIDGQKVGDTCTDAGMTSCPRNSTCLPKGCDGTVCQCDDGFVPSTESDACKIAVDLGQPCGGAEKLCRAVFSYCSLGGVCECVPPFVAAEDNLRCKPGPYVPGTLYALLGERCPPGTQCFGQNLECDDVCVCADGYRAATEAERLAEPFSPFECRENGYRLENITAVCPSPPPPLDSNINERCLSDNNCPANSECVPRGCDGKVCVCEMGRRATPDDTQCLTAVPIGGDCTANDTICARSGFETRCSAEGRCECMDDLEDRNGRCRIQSRVIPPFYVRRVALLGEECGVQRINDIMYVDSCGEPLTVCVDGYCRCQEKYRKASPAEKLGYPDRFSDCVFQNYTLVMSNINERCLSDNNCPANSECVPRGCDGKVCVCEMGRRATPDDTQCLTAVPIGGDCTANDTLCARSGLETRCSAEGRCECMEDLEDRNGRCRIQSRVIPPFYVRRVAMRGEECGVRRKDGVMYVDTCGEPLTVCVGGVCQCAEKYREASPEEKLSDPDRFSDCVFQNYTLDVDFNECHIDVNPRRQETTTATALV